MEQAEFEGSSPMTPLSQPSPNLPPKLNKLAHVRVQHWITLWLTMHKSLMRKNHFFVYWVHSLRCDVYNHYTVAFPIDFVVFWVPSQTKWKPVFCLCVFSGVISTNNIFIPPFLLSKNWQLEKCPNFFESTILDKPFYQVKLLQY